VWLGGKAGMIGGVSPAGGFGIPTNEPHQFVTEGDVGAWISNAIAAGLRTKGYNAEQNIDREENAKTPFVIKVDVLDVVAQRPAMPSFSCEGRVWMHISVLRREKETANREPVLDRFYEGHSKEPGECPPTPGTPADLGGTIRRALEDMVNSLVPDIVVVIAARRRWVGRCKSCGDTSGSKPWLGPGRFPSR